MGVDFLYVRLIMAGIITLWALVADWRTYQISNRIIYTGFLAGFLVLLVDKGRADYLLGGVCAFALMFVIYMVGGVGAGDVKLLGVLGFLVGFQFGVLVVAGSLCAGLLIGVIGIFWNRCKSVSIAISGRKFVGHGFHFTIAIVIAQIVTSLYMLGGAGGFA